MIMMKNKKILFAVVLVLIIGAIVYFESQKPMRAKNIGDAEINKQGITLSVGEKIKKYERAKEIVNPSGFLNIEGEETKIADMVGKKVILVDFWTYSCINCQRTTPYLNAWYEKYRDKGLEIVGIHTPEFEFEKDTANVRQAIEKFDIKYPVVQDNDYATWQAYKNQYWPRKYLIDIDGFIVYDHIGEGAYEETEKKIQELLEERRVALGESVEFDRNVTQPENVIDTDTTEKKTSEIYFGAARNSRYLGNGSSAVEGQQNFTLPQNLLRDRVYLQGQWRISNEFAKNPEAGAKIVLPYRARDVYMVLSAPNPVRIRVYIDGQVVSEIKGVDVGEDGLVVIEEENLYRLVEAGEYGEHLLELEILDSGLEAFTFTFG